MSLAGILTRRARRADVTGAALPLGRAIRVTLLLAALAGVAGLSACSRAPQDEVWVVGFDGADWDLLDPMLAAGELPNLAALREGGAWGRLRSDEPMLSPILWTSIATGKTPDLHGVTWFMTDAPDGSKIPISSRSRQVRALWNVASEHGLRVGVVGWWATWPVEPVNGFIISDYVAWHSFGITGTQLDVPGKTYPAALMDDVRKTFRRPDQVPDALLQTMVHLPPDRLGVDASAGPFGGPVQHLRQAIVTTEGYTELALQRLHKQRPQLFAIYYEGTDAVAHLFMEYAAPRLPWVSEADFAAYQDVVHGYWKWQDQQLGRLLAARRPGTTIVIVSDHGFRVGGERLKEKEFSIETADQSHMPDGIVLINGPRARAGARIEGASIYDVAPTVLHLLGIPVAADLSGHVLTAALDPAFEQQHPASTVPTYETGAWDRGDALVVDPAAGERMEEMLRSLGYIAGGAQGQAAADSAARAATHAAPGSSAPGSPATHTLEQSVNLAVVLRKQGRFDEAVQHLERALQVDPHNLEARANLARTYADMGRLGDAEQIYRGMVADNPADLQSVEDLALAMAHQGRAADALKVYEQGLAHDPHWARGLAGRGFALHGVGRSQEGLAALDAALQQDPQLAIAHYYRGVVLRALGRKPEAVAALERAHQLDPVEVGTVLALVSLRQEAGDVPGAERLLRDGMTAAGDDARLSAALGALLLQQQQTAQALPLLESAARRSPTDLDVQGNYGIAEAMSGNLPKAAAAFERVIALDPKSHEGRAQLAVFYAQMGQLDRAETLTQEAIKLQPQSGRYVYQLAMIYDAQGKKTLAQQTLNRARALDPSLPMPGQAPQR